MPHDAFEDQRCTNWIDAIVDQRLAKLQLGVFAHKHDKNEREVATGVESRPLESAPEPKPKRRVTVPATETDGVDPSLLIAKFNDYVRELHPIIYRVFEPTCTAYFTSKWATKDESAAANAARAKAKEFLQAHSAPYKAAAERYEHLVRARADLAGVLRTICKNAADVKAELAKYAADKHLQPGFDQKLALREMAEADPEFAKRQKASRELLAKRNALKAELERVDAELENFIGQMEIGWRALRSSGPIAEVGNHNPNQSVVNYVVLASCLGSFRGKFDLKENWHVLRTLGHFFAQTQDELKAYRTPMSGDLGEQDVNALLFLTNEQRERSQSPPALGVHPICDVWSQVSQYGINIFGHRWTQDFEFQRVAFGLCKV